ncbi:MAG: hypothetical protein JNK11_20775 [Alphaproteobacteria bacterium]|nr:hypothetical protein [Alphaproteobacteria bacterium]
MAELAEQLAGVEPQPISVCDESTSAEAPPEATQADWDRCEATFKQIYADLHLDGFIETDIDRLLNYLPADYFDDATWVLGRGIDVEAIRTRYECNRSCMDSTGWLYPLREEYVLHAVQRICEVLDHARTARRRRANLRLIDSCTIK